MQISLCHCYIFELQAYCTFNYLYILLYFQYTKKHCHTECLLTNEMANCFKYFFTYYNVIIILLYTFIFYYNKVFSNVIY